MFSSDRSELGKISLDKVFRERENLNFAIVESLNKASASWGLVCFRYEIRKIFIFLVFFFFFILLLFFSTSWSVRLGIFIENADCSNIFTNNTHCPKYRSERFLIFH